MTLSRDQFSRDQLPPDQLSRDQLTTRPTLMVSICNEIKSFFFVVEKRNETHVLLLSEHKVHFDI